MARRASRVGAGDLHRLPAAAADPGHHGHVRDSARRSPPGTGGPAPGRRPARPSTRAAPAPPRPPRSRAPRRSRPGSCAGWPARPGPASGTVRPAGPPAAAGSSRTATANTWCSTPSRKPRWPAQRSASPSSRSRASSSPSTSSVRARAPAAATARSRPRMIPQTVAACSVSSRFRSSSSSGPDAGSAAERTVDQVGDHVVVDHDRGYRDGAGLGAQPGQRHRPAVLRGRGEHRGQRGRADRRRPAARRRRPVPRPAAAGAGPSTTHRGPGAVRDQPHHALHVGVLGGQAGQVAVHRDQLAQQLVLPPGGAVGLGPGRRGPGAGRPSRYGHGVKRRRRSQAWPGRICGRTHVITDGRG